MSLAAWFTMEVMYLSTLDWSWTKGLASIGTALTGS